MQASTHSAAAMAWFDWSGTQQPLSSTDEYYIILSIMMVCDKVHPLLSFIPLAAVFPTFPTTRGTFERVDIISIE